MNLTAEIGLFKIIDLQIEYFNQLLCCERPAPLLRSDQPVRCEQPARPVRSNQPVRCVATDLPGA